MLLLSCCISCFHWMRPITIAFLQRHHEYDCLNIGFMLMDFPTIMTTNYISCQEILRIPSFASLHYFGLFLQKCQQDILISDRNHAFGIEGVQRAKNYQFEGRCFMLSGLANQDGTKVKNMVQDSIVSSKLRKNFPLKIYDLLITTKAS